MKNKPLSVSVVIPNWNGKYLLEKNLPAVLAAAPKAQIIVADDASEDGSVEFLKKIYPKIIVVENEKQQGFAGNVNSGVVKATGDIIVLLNTDVRPEKGFLEPLLARFSEPKVAAVGCLEKSHEGEKIVLRGRGVARWEKGYYIHSRGEVDSEDTAWVAGGSAAFRRSVWNELGGMDTRFNPFYWEDIDLSYRIQKAGYKIFFEKKSVVHHYHEEGKIKSIYSSRDVKLIAYRNQFLFHWKHIPNARIWIAHCIWTPVRLVQAAIKGDWLMLQGLFLAIIRI
ncbi:MAG TPA: glycosyltransferase family 2 protein [Patescibacteria group bacterium]|nr:glycosyltransferase family 2 protein [Patescibacteria group bacterium]